MIQVINLTSRPDRLQYIQEELKFQDQHSIILLEASETSVGYPVPEYYDPYNDQYIRSGELGCALSHMRALANIVEGKDDFGIILEDDFQFLSEDLRRWNLNELCQKTYDQTQFDIFYLTRIARDRRKDIPIQSLQFNWDSIELITPGRSWWNLGYAVSKKAARDVLHRFAVRRNLLVVDEMWPMLTGHGSPKLLDDFPEYVGKMKAVALKDRIAVCREGSDSATYCSIPAVPDVHPHDIRIVSVATEENDMTLRYRDSCRMYNLPLTFIGLDILPSKWMGGDMAYGPGGGQKILLLRRYLEEEKLTERNDIYIVFTDGYDVVSNASIKTLREKIKSEPSHLNSQVLFACESGCWPDANRANDYPVSPVSGVHNRYLNSGLFIGPAQAIYQMLTSKIMSDVKSDSDDQRYYTSCFLESHLTKAKMRLSHFTTDPIVMSNTLPDIRLDYEEKFFQCLAGRKDNLHKNPSLSWIEFEGRRPVFIHGNGSAIDKDYFEYIQRSSIMGHVDSYGSYTNRTPAEIKDRTFNTKIFAAVIIDRTDITNEWIERLCDMSDAPDVFMIAHLPELQEQAEIIFEQLNATYSDDGRIFKIISGQNPLQLMKKTTSEFALFDDSHHDECFYLYYGSSAIPHVDTISDLIHDIHALSWRSVVGPMLHMRDVRHEDYAHYTNFWGAIDRTNMYARSLDYKDLVHGRSTGTYNVPHVSEFLMMRRQATDVMHTCTGPTMVQWIRKIRDHHLIISINLKRKISKFDFESYTYDSESLPDYYSTLLPAPEQILGRAMYSDPTIWQKRYFHDRPDRLVFDEIKVPEQRWSRIHYGKMVTTTFCHEMITYSEKNKNKWKYVGDGVFDPRLGGVEHAATNDIYLSAFGCEQVSDYIMEQVVAPWAWREYEHRLKKFRLAFCVKYSPDAQPALKHHCDASKWSLDIALNEGNGVDFVGGGVHYKRMDLAVPLDQPGYVCIHPGAFVHAGMPTTAGTRRILVLFSE